MNEESYFYIHTAAYYDETGVRDGGKYCLVHEGEYTDSTEFTLDEIKSLYALLGNLLKYEDPNFKKRRKSKRKKDKRKPLRK